MSLRSLCALCILAAACVSTPPSYSLLDREEISDRMMHFYEAPDPKLVEVFLRSMSAERLLDRPEAVPPTLDFFATAARQYPSEVGVWADVISDLPRADQQHYWTAIWLADISEGRLALSDALDQGLISPDPDWLRRPPPSLQTLEVKTADDLDILWGAFFASGDTMYVGRILAVLDWDLEQVKRRYEADQQQGMMELAVWSAAQWALKSNSQQHERVLQYCRDELLRAKEPRLSLLRAVVAEAEAGR